MTSTKKKIFLCSSAFILSIITFFALLAILSTIKIALILLIPVFLLIILGIISDIKKYKTTKTNFYGFISAIFSCSFLFWPSFLVALFTNYITIILYCICFLIIIKLYTIFNSEQRIF